MIIGKLPSPWMIDQYVAIYLSKREELIKRSTPEVDFIERVLKLRPGSKILDLGCGEGRHSIELARRGYIVKGVDISPVLIDAAKDRAARLGVPVEFEVADIREYAVDEEYDAILLMFVVLGDSGNEDDDFQILRNSFKSLRKGGKVLASFLNASRQLVRRNQKFNIETSTITWSADIDIGKIKHHLTQPVRLYFPSEAKMLMKCCGFEVLSLFGDPFGSDKPVERSVRPDDLEFLILGRKPEE